MLRKFYLENDDYTFIYGGLMFEAEYDESSDTFKEPYIRKEKYNKVIKFYPSKKFFITYDEDNMIDRIVFVMTCWSDDYIDYAVYNKKGIYYHECYHGKINKKRIECDIDFSDFIAKNGL